MVSAEVIYVGTRHGTLRYRPILPVNHSLWAVSSPSTRYLSGVQNRAVLAHVRVNDTIYAPPDPAGQSIISRSWPLRQRIPLTQIIVPLCRLRLLTGSLIRMVLNVFDRRLRKGVGGKL